MQSNPRKLLHDRPSDRPHLSFTIASARPDRRSTPPSGPPAPGSASSLPSTSCPVWICACQGPSVSEISQVGDRHHFFGVESDLATEVEEAPESRNDLIKSDGHDTRLRDKRGIGLIESEQPFVVPGVECLFELMMYLFGTSGWTDVFSCRLAAPSGSDRHRILVDFGQSPGRIPADQQPNA